MRGYSVYALIHIDLMQLPYGIRLHQVNRLMWITRLSVPAWLSTTRPKPEIASTAPSQLATPVSDLVH